ncbi:hypothetical protein QNO00_05130 [Arthrobacter sp. zg-Y1219]|uniref:hypothetical protein n=1 Tax=Arthrobacter sp. zg-Y1219 TaxID=3049067 RepID=UPI0024C3D19F|nr:hypothetical protein [Arthrobacter sp. zg-Y1219]MDK1359648.1 hypothetical protein [Arthrobacter sp. zg-Y1219]
MDFGLAELEQRLPDADTVRAHAAEIMAIGARADELMDSVRHTWLLLAAPGVYSVPGNDIAFSALDRSGTVVAELANYTIQLDTLMKAYAESVEWFKSRVQELQARAADFDAEFPESEIDEWNNDEQAVNARNSIARDVSRLLSELDEAQRDAANRIANITGSERSYTEHDNIMRDGLIPYGYDEYDHFAAGGGKMHRDLPWYQDTWDTIAGVPMALGETVEDVGVLVGAQGWPKAGDAWKGMYRVGENAVVLGLGSRITGDERTAAAKKEMELLGQDLIRLEQWEGEHPGHALGGNLFDVAALFVGGGLVKAGIKAGTRGAHGADSNVPSRPGADGHALTRSGAAVPPGTAHPPGTRVPEWKDKARTSLENLGRRLLPENQGLVPALPGGFVPGNQGTPDVPDNGIWFKDGKPRIPFLSSYGPFATNPSDQPQPGDTGGGNGFYRDEPRTQHGAPEQQYVTGVDRVDDGHAREYVMEQPNGKEVSFDGHQWRWDYRSDPPVYREHFTEVKGYYSWMWPSKLTEEFDGWIDDELLRQKAALDHSASEGYVHEMVFTEKPVMDAFDEYLPADSPLRENLILRFEEIPNYPAPPNRKG